MYRSLFRCHYSKVALAASPGKVGLGNAFTAVHQASPSYLHLVSGGARLILSLADAQYAGTRVQVNETEWMNEMN